MKLLKKIFAFTLPLTLGAGVLHAQTGTELDQKALTESLVQSLEKKGISRAHTESVLSQAVRRNSILRVIQKPAESKPWHEYRNIFLQKNRINAGADFISKHQDLFDAAYKKYGVDPHIIAAIIGVETFYGTRMGRHRILDALYTLGFFYPKRADFFRAELGYFIELADNQGWNTTEKLGSYAGAMGMGQFIPSSYQHYAVDGDNDGKIDLFTSIPDAIFSVANYFKVHGWVKDKVAFIEAEPTKPGVDTLIYKGLKPKHVADDLIKRGVSFEVPLSDDEKVKLIRYAIKPQHENANISYDYLIGTKNYYVITRYNRSKLYARAVSELADAIRDKLKAS